ncbi:hypothetical protein CMV_021545 [Castanea mollissima]|uniref:Pentatricopeptide repeat-containing protein n=1 Tax=Castanea mollissima TaxID=60419 RepID=A0A8J4V933_9ROSI|nr:hypothetical protein CMV_021545 [Castanea mollissima]
MDSTITAPLDPVVMAQQIQALIANVQELMKQNEDLKRKVRLEGTSTSHSWRNRNDNDDEAYSPGNSKRETSEHTAQSTHGSNQMIKNFSKEFDEVKNAMKGKTAGTRRVSNSTDTPSKNSPIPIPFPTHPEPKPKAEAEAEAEAEAGKEKAGVAAEVEEVTPEASPHRLWLKRWRRRQLLRLRLEMELLSRAKGRCGGVRDDNESMIILSFLRRVQKHRPSLRDEPKSMISESKAVLVRVEQQSKLPIPSGDELEILVAFAGIYPDDLFHVKSIHAQIITNSVSKNQFLATKLVKAYCDLGHVGDARKVFDLFSQPKTILCNAMAFMEFLDFEMGGEVIRKAVDKEVESDQYFLGSSMNNFLVKFNSIDEARRVFDAMAERKVICWNLMIGGYVQAHHFNEAFGLFFEMHRLGIRPSQVTMASIIQAYMETRNLKLGKFVHGCVFGLGMGYDVLVLISLVDMNGCGMPGHGHQADGVYKKMIKEGLIKPNQTTFVAVLTACNHSGLVEEGFTLFHRM